MKLPRRPLKRVIALTSAVAIIGGAAAIAETVPVTVAVVNGSRSLTVTGSDGTLPVGTPSLAFSGTGTKAPFGVVVTDALYDRKGYTVSATLSNLYKLDTASTGGVNCNAAIPASAFDITFDTRPPVSALKAVVDTLIDFEDDDIVGEVTTVDSTLAAILTTVGVTTIPVTVADVIAAAQEVDASGLTTLLMGVTDGAGGTFTGQASHPTCLKPAGAITSVPLQVGTPNNPTLAEIDALRDTLYTSVTGDLAADLTSTTALAEGLIPPGSDLPGGDMYEKTKLAVDAALDGILALAGEVTEEELDAITALVVDDLVAQLADLALTLIGQSGVYPNLPELNLDTAKAGDPTTGTYHGVMTVTLLDAP